MTGTGFDEDEVPPFLQPLKVPMATSRGAALRRFIQAKFFEIDETLTDLHIPWADIIRTLRAAGTPAGCPATRRAPRTYRGRGGPPPARARARWRPRRSRLGQAG
jgi:hypothetical protein